MKIIAYWAPPFYPFLSDKYHWRMWKHLTKNKTGLALKYSWQNWMKYYKLLYLTNRSIGKERIVASQIQRITEVIAFKMYILLGSTYWKQRCSKWRSNRTSNVCLFSTVLKLKIYCFWRSNLIIFAIYSNTKKRKFFKFCITAKICIEVNFHANRCLAAQKNQKETPCFEEKISKSYIKLTSFSTLKSTKTRIMPQSYTH